MHRRALLQAICRYWNRHPDERAVVEGFTDFIARHPDCFERSLAIGHVTGSAWVGSPDGTRVLLNHHRRLNIWVQCGGHADGDQDVLAVARREMEEESGLTGSPLLDGEIFDLDIHRIPARPGQPEHDHYDVRFAFRATGTQLSVSHESHDLVWIDPVDLPRYTTETSMVRMAEKWQRIGRTA